MIFVVECLNEENLPNEPLTASTTNNFPRVSWNTCVTLVGSLSRNVLTSSDCVGTTGCYYLKQVIIVSL